MRLFFLFPFDLVVSIFQNWMFSGCKDFDFILYFWYGRFEIWIFDRCALIYTFFFAPIFISFSYLLSDFDWKEKMNNFYTAYTSLQFPRKMVYIRHVHLPLEYYHHHFILIFYLVCQIYNLLCVRSTGINFLRI